TTSGSRPWASEMEQQLFPVDLPADAPAPHLHEALSSIVPQILLAECLQLAKDHVGTGDYMARFQTSDAVQYPAGGDPDAVSVINPSDNASFVEEGHAGFHLPSRIRDWTIGKDGRRYKRVMFQHGVPAAAGGGVSTTRSRMQMPPAVYARARQLGAGD